MITDIASNKLKLNELEDDLLIKLTSVQGSLIEDVSLIQVLNTAKKTANNIKEKITIAQDTELKINTAREEYRPSKLIYANYLSYFVI